MRIATISLGCAKNLVDTEALLTSLNSPSNMIVNNLEEADIVLVNTCSFIAIAREESIATLDNVLSKMNTSAKLIIAGCLLENQLQLLQTRYPNAILLPQSKYADLSSILVDIELNNNPISKVRIGCTHTAYLKIAEGCNHRCGFCAIPNIRGPYHSYPVASILKEMEAYVSSGVKEVTIVAQDTSYYGKDNNSINFASLLELLATKYPYILFRISYLYISEITDELIDVIAKYDNIYKYFDIPLQHASNKILKAMNRPLLDIRQLIYKIRKKISNPVLRTSIIVGYPGETNDDIDLLLSLIKEIQFDHLGCFIYSREKDTYSYSLGDQVSEATKRQRYNIVMKTQQKISRDKKRALKKKTFMAFIDQITDEFVTGHCYYNSFSGEDGLLYFELKNNHQVGDYILVMVDANLTYDLIVKEV